MADSQSPPRVGLFKSLQLRLSSADVLCFFAFGMALGAILQVSTVRQQHASLALRISDLELHSNLISHYAPAGHLDTSTRQANSNSFSAMATHLGSISAEMHSISEKLTQTIQEVNHPRFRRGWQPPYESPPPPPPCGCGRHLHCKGTQPQEAPKPIHRSFCGTGNFNERIILSRDTAPASVQTPPSSQTGATPDQQSAATPPDAGAPPAAAPGPDQGTQANSNQQSTATPDAGAPGPEQGTQATSDQVVQPSTSPDQVSHAAEVTVHIPAASPDLAESLKNPEAAATVPTAVTESASTSSTSNTTAPPFIYAYLSFDQRLHNVHAQRVIPIEIDKVYKSNRMELNSATHSIVIPQSGHYLVTLSLQITGSAQNCGAETNLLFMRNGQPHDIMSRALCNSNEQTRYAVSIPMPLEQGDTIGTAVFFQGAEIVVRAPYGATPLGSSNFLFVKWLH